MISADKTSLSSDEELNISASVSGFTTNEKIYVKGSFFKDGSSNYFGFTKNNDIWIKNSTTALSQKEVVIGSWDNSVKTKPDFSDTGFSGAGNYKFKLGFYYLTGGGNVSSINWSSNDLIISLSSPPSIENSQTPIKTSMSSKSSSGVSKAPSATKTPTSSSQAVLAASTKNPSKSVKISTHSRSASEYAKIKTITQNDNKKDVKVLGTKESNFSPIILLSGIVILLAAVFMFVKKELEERNTL